MRQLIEDTVKASLEMIVKSNGGLLIQVPSRPEALQASRQRHM
jgi:hypothetical protein